MPESPLVFALHAGIGFELVAALDALVLQMVDQLVDVLQFFDTFRPVVAELVIEVPKIMHEDSIPQRAALREPQLVEQLVDLPTEPVFVEQTVHIPAPDGGGRLRLREGLVVEVFKVVSLDRFQQRHPQFLAL